MSVARGVIARGVIDRSVLVQAIRGPIMLITLGALVALDYFRGVSFVERTWPALLIVFGLLKLLEMAGRPAPQSGVPQ
jgi:hypothetical protein